VAARTIAELLKRSPSAIRKRARLTQHQLGRSRPGPTARKKTVAFLMAVQHRGTNWTPEEDRRLLDLIKAGKSWVFISANLKRPVKSVQDRARQLKAKK